MLTPVGFAVYVAVHTACVIGNVLALIAIILCLRKKKNVKSVGAIWLGVIAALLGASVMLMCDRPLPNFEEALFYWSAVPVLIGIAAVILGVYKNETTEPNQSIQTTNRTVTECAPSRTFHASAIRV